MELERIKKEVENSFGISNIAEKTRYHEMIIARQIFYKLARALTFEPLTNIGRSVGKNHATVLNGIKEWDYTNQRWEKEAKLIYHKLRQKLSPEMTKSKIGRLDVLDLLEALPEEKMKEVEQFLKQLL